MTGVPRTLLKEVVVPGFNSLATRMFLFTFERDREHCVPMEQGSQLFQIATVESIAIAAQELTSTFVVVCGYDLCSAPCGWSSACLVHTPGWLFDRFGRLPHCFRLFHYALGCHSFRLLLG